MTHDHATGPAGWHDGCLLGYAPLDHVHEEFVTLVDALRQAPHDGIAAALDAVHGHVLQHFDTENAWMTDTGFPASECHMAEHAAVLRSVEGVRRRVALGDHHAARRLAQALAEWFPGHADHLDSALAHWMCKLRLGGKPVVVRRHIHTTVPAALR